MCHKRMIERRTLDHIYAICIDEPYYLWYSTVADTKKKAPCPICFARSRHEVLLLMNNKELPRMSTLSHRSTRVDISYPVIECGSLSVLLQHQGPLSLY